jgi:hypothetical protein
VTIVVVPGFQQFHNPLVKAHKCSSFSKHSKQQPFVVAIPKLSFHNLQGMNKMGLESKTRSWLLDPEKRNKLCELLNQVVIAWQSF